MVARDGVEPPTPAFSVRLIFQQLNFAEWPQFCDHSVTSADVRLASALGLNASGLRPSDRLKNFFSTALARDFPRLQLFLSLPNLPLYGWRLEAEVQYLLIEPLSAMRARALPPPHRSGLLSVSLQTRLNRAQAGKGGSTLYRRQSLQSACMPLTPRKPRRSEG